MLLIVIYIHYLIINGAHNVSRIIAFVNMQLCSNEIYVIVTILYN